MLWRSERDLLQNRFGALCMRSRSPLLLSREPENQPRPGANCLVTSRARQAASSLFHSASLVQPARMKYWASSADISTVPSGPTLRCRPEKV